MLQDRHAPAPRTFFEGGLRRGNVAALEVVFAQLGNYDLNVEIHLDGKLSQTLTFSQQSAGGAVGWAASWVGGNR